LSITAHAPVCDQPAAICAGCHGSKGAPIATILSIYHGDVGVTVALCEECGRDTANAIGFMCIRDGGWSKLEARKRTPAQYKRALERSSENPKSKSQRSVR
jgi:hypothetical protein